MDAGKGNVESEVRSLVINGMVTGSVVLALSCSHASALGAFPASVESLSAAS